MLEFRNIRKSFSGVEVLHGISFQAEPAKIIAIVGENGAGKSTLMRILSGILPDYQGEIFLNNNLLRARTPRAAEQVGISMIHQELNLVQDLSIGENIFLGKEPTMSLGRVNFSKIFEESDKLLHEFKFPFSSKTKVRNLSVGWQQMVEIAKALRQNANVIIMDEPTSALSESEIILLFEKIRYLKSLGKMVLYISHRLQEVFDLADEIVVLRDGNLMGKFETDKISRDELISLMIGREVAEESTAKTGGNSENLLQVHDLTLTHKNRTILSGINFSLQKGEVLGIAGLLGAGRTELLKFLYGEFPADHSGTISFMGESFIPDNPGKAIGKGIIYLSEDRQREGIFQHHQLIFNSSISALAQFSTVGYIHTSTEKEAVNEKFGELNVRKSSMQQKISTLSGGNQQKVLLSRILLLNPRLLLLDEPTRGIDVGAKQDIYQLIEELSGKGISMIVTSSEIPELMWICHRILVLSQGRQTAILESSKTNSREILHFAFQQV